MNTPASLTPTVAGLSTPLQAALVVAASGLVQVPEESRQACCVPAHSAPSQVLATMRSFLHTGARVCVEAGRSQVAGQGGKSAASQRAMQMFVFAHCRTSPGFSPAPRSGSSHSVVSGGPFGVGVKAAPAPVQVPTVTAAVWRPFSRHVPCVCTASPSSFMQPMTRVRVDASRSQSNGQASYAGAFHAYVHFGLAGHVCVSDGLGVRSQYGVPAYGGHLGTFAPVAPFVSYPTRQVPTADCVEPDGPGVSKSQSSSLKHVTVRVSTTSGASHSVGQAPKSPVCQL